MSNTTKYFPRLGSPESAEYRVLLDENWGLDDLAKFPHAYSQAYSFVYCFDAPFESKNPERVDKALQQYPWMGGYSYLNIYTVLKYQIPADRRPEIGSIQFASPGWIDLLLEPESALRIAKSVGIICGAGVTIAAAVKSIDAIRLSINRQRREDRAQAVAISAREAQQLNALCDELAKNIGFGNLKALHRRTKSPEVSVNLLLAHYRRLEQLAEYVKQGQASLPEKLKDGTTRQLTLPGASK